MKRLYERLNLEFLSPTWNYNVSLVGYCGLLLEEERIKVWIFKSHGKTYFLALKDGKPLQLIDGNTLQKKLDNAINGIYEVCDIRLDTTGENSAWNKYKYEFFQTYGRDIEREEYETFVNIAVINPENVQHITSLTGVTIYNKNDMKRVDKTEFEKNIF